MFAAAVSVHCRLNASRNFQADLGPSWVKPTRTVRNQTATLPKVGYVREGGAKFLKVGAVAGQTQQFHHLYRQVN